MPFLFGRSVLMDSPCSRRCETLTSSPVAGVSIRVLLGLAFTFACSACPSTSALAANIEVNAAETHQVMNGFGSSERLFDDPHVFGDNPDPVTGRSETVLTQAERDWIMDLLYVDLGLTRVRPLIANGVEEVNDNDDPYVTDLSGFDFSWKKNDDHVDYVMAALDRGSETFWLSPLQFESFMTDENPEEYVEWAMAIHNRWRSLGLDLPFYSIINEPTFHSIINEPTFRAGVYSPQYGREVIKLLGPELRAQGFDTMFVVADDINSGATLGYSRVVLADEEALPYIGAVAFHLYGDYQSGELKERSITRLSELAASYSLPLWMSEFSGISDGWEWGLLMHELLVGYDVAAIDFLFGAFGQQAGGSTYVRLLYDGPTYLGPDLTKKYYYTGHFSRFVRPGAQRIGATSTDPDVRV